MIRTATASLAAVSVLLGLTVMPCSGRTSNLRGSSTTLEQVQETVNNSSGVRRGGNGRKLETASSGVGSGASAANGTTPALPTCASIYVPSMAAALQGTYTFMGRYNNGRPVYVNPGTSSNMFSMSVQASEPGGWGGPPTWYITQPAESSNFFLSLQSDVFEPTELVGLSPWVRNNDPSCPACVTKFRISCSVLMADEESSSPASAASSPFTPASNTSAVTAGANSTSDPIYADEAGTSVTPTASPTTAAPVAHTVGGDSSYAAGTGPISSVSTSTGSEVCSNLNIGNGAERKGVYAVNTDADGTVILHNERPTYSVVGDNRTDEVFSLTMDVCSGGYGVVDADWAEAHGLLLSGASVRTVFLTYVAENLGLDNESDTCEKDVWLVTSGGASSLAEVEGIAFLSVSDVEDPSEVTSWAKFTPGSRNDRARLEENFWVDIRCASDDEVVAAAEAEEEKKEEEGEESVEEESVTGGGVGAASTSSALVPTEKKETPSTRRLRAALDLYSLLLTTK